MLSQRPRRFAATAFAWWRRHEADSMHRRTLRSYDAGLKSVVRSLLAQGVACPCAWTAKPCRQPLSAEATLWAFAAAEGVPPHNSATERALRRGVIWWKTSFGTDAEAVIRYGGRMLTVVATCRQRGYDVLGSPSTFLRAQLDGTPVLLRLA